SGPARRCCWWMTCSPPAARCAPPPRSWSGWAGSFPGWPFSSNWPTCAAATACPATPSRASWSIDGCRSGVVGVRRDDAELLAESEGIPTVESGDDHAVAEVVEAHAGDADRAPGRRDAEELSRVGAGQRPAGDDGVALGDQFLQFEVD